ncbi:hypothetical protein E4U53_000478 [Claviceps sorghi]|nr:hypothetical protein E4U53_000478 [Claviceps sorghi]
MNKGIFVKSYAVGVVSGKQASGIWSYTGPIVAKAGIRVEERGQATSRCGQSGSHQGDGHEKRAAQHVVDGSEDAKRWMG